MHQYTGKPVYRTLFAFWPKIFGVAFGMGVVSGVVMAFQFGTNWNVLSKMSGPIQGPLLSYETFTAFMLEAGFFGILIFGRPRVPPWFYLFSTAMVALGTTLSAFWIMVSADAALCRGRLSRLPRQDRRDRGSLLTLTRPDPRQKERRQSRRLSRLGCFGVRQDFGITPGLLSGHCAISFSSMLKCCATSFGGVCVSQLESDTSS